MADPTDWIEYDYDMLMTRNESPEWKHSITSRALVLMRFLRDNNLLISIDPFEEDGSIKKNLVVKKSDLTEEGAKIFSKAWIYWENYLDRGGDVNNISRLENGLKRIRQGKAG